MIIATKEQQKELVKLKKQIASSKAKIAKYKEAIKAEKSLVATSKDVIKSMSAKTTKPAE
jgi:septal ring factor EnvC (AmiA/AmiB activator)